MHTRNHKSDYGTVSFEMETRQEAIFPAANPENAGQQEAGICEKTKQPIESVAACMQYTAEVIRKHETSDGLVHDAGEAIAEKLEAGGRYLKDNGLAGIGEDATNLIRQNPIPALMVGLGLGVLLARFIRS